MEGRGVIRIQIDSFGRGGTVATLSPSLALIVEHPVSRPRAAKNTGALCDRCGRPIQTFGFLHGLGEPERPERVLRCECVCIIYRPPIAKADILKNWPDFRRLKSQILARLAPAGAN
jgi:hypothetical protein